MSARQKPANRFAKPLAGRFAGMRRIPSGSFAMGAEGFYDDEAPIRQVSVDGFWIDETPVTNAQFARFVAATGHVTQAEVAPDPANYPGMDPALAKPASIVFMPPDHAVDLTGVASWWAMVPGADWQHPIGAGSTIAGMERHPVVHIGYADALAYAEWAGKALPTEAEWEYAARGGLDGATYAWGDVFNPGGRRMAKTWDGDFPHYNAARLGHERTSPVKSYPRNGHGLYDMIGNVWEWTVDLYDRDATDAAPECCGGDTRDLAQIPRHVVKGGSHLCAPSYCRRYRPAARWPQPIDTTTSHIGFRCVVRVRR